MDDINLHFTGDFHAITAAHNLLAAMVDNHLYWGNKLALDPDNIVWRRAIDMNDRSLRQIVTSLGSDGEPANTGLDITVASEVMAVLCLAENLADLQARLGRIIIGYRGDGAAVTCVQLKADGAMTALLKDAILPNLVQTLEGTPTFIHGGPFANIAHDCNSVVATRTALKLADFVVTEAGFGADLGAEKFFNIKCHKTGLAPKAVVIVATIRSLKMNGGLDKSSLHLEDVAALERGCANLGRHLENIRQFGVPAVVAINHFVQDTHAEVAIVRKLAGSLGVEAILCRHWERGGADAEELAQHVVHMVKAGATHFMPLYDDALPLIDKIRVVAQRIYRADTIVAEQPMLDQLALWQAGGFAHLPVCMAKTQYSFSTDPTRLDAPADHQVRIRKVRLAAGAGFIVAICGEVMTLPGLPRRPGAERIGVDAHGQIIGLF